MVIILDLAYLVALLAALPFLVVKSLRTGKYRSGWKGRFGMGEEVFRGGGEGVKVLLLHCVSVGELLSVQTLVANLLAADEKLRIIVISTGTDTGTARAEQLFPLGRGGSRGRTRGESDGAASPRFFLRRGKLHVKLGAARRHCGSRGARDLAQFSEQPPRAAAFPWQKSSTDAFPKNPFRAPPPHPLGDEGDVAKCAAGSGRNAAHRRAAFIGVGADKTKVEVIPTLKYDNAALSEVVGTESLAKAIGLSDRVRLLVAGSTGPGEEEPVLAAYQAVRAQHPEARLAIVPRHPEVVPQVIAAIEKRGLKPVRRTGRPDGAAANPLQPNEVFVLDTMGELRGLYALAFGVFSRSQPRETRRERHDRGRGGWASPAASALGPAISRKWWNCSWRNRPRSSCAMRTNCNTPGTFTDG